MVLDPHISIEFVIVGCCFSKSHLALESQAHFLAVAEHRLVPARARNVITQLRQAGMEEELLPLQHVSSNLMIVKAPVEMLF